MEEIKYVVAINVFIDIVFFNVCIVLNSKKNLPSHQLKLVVTLINSA